MNDLAIAAIALTAGIVTGAVWSRWRHQVVKELRTIRCILQDEQEPLLRAIRRALEAEQALNRSDEDRPN